ncbi:MAG: DUF6305 family protein [Bacilli bacterium]|nr:DUF6305 family protein [Bacilli bacterium]
MLKQPFFKSNIKNILSFLMIILSSLFVLTGCQNKDPLPEEEPIYEIPSEFFGIVQDKKVYITSIGQAIDIENFMIYISHLAETIDFEYVYETEIAAKDIEEGSLVFLIVGCSIKAMSDAGITLDSEIDRANEFVELGKNHKATLVSWHLGGTSRRGTTSDGLIEIVFSNSDLNIFVKSGNADNFLSKTSMDNDVPMYQISAISSLTEPLMILFGVE